MDQSAKFWDKTAERYAARPIANEAVYEKKLEKTREYFERDMEVLEFGCGTGSTAIAHAPFVKHIQAIDFSSNMIEIAQGRADAAGVRNVTFATATIDDLEAADETFDAVLGLNILHLLEDKEAVIAKVHKVLKHSGVFVTSTVCLGGAMKLLSWIVPIGKLFGLMPQLKAFSTQELRESLTRAGFTIDYQWVPGNGKSIFVVAKKTE
jgi:ubiquinone/menaquinone biosynthesis C-methylase UbiE